jgi:hypothetical protein
MSEPVSSKCLNRQVSVRFFLANSRSVDANHRVRRLHNTDEFDVWVKLKVSTLSLVHASAKEARRVNWHLV